MEEKTKIIGIILILALVAVFFGKGILFAIVGETEMPIVLSSTCTYQGENANPSKTYYENFFGQKSITFNYSLYASSPWYFPGSSPFSLAGISLGGQGILSAVGTSGINCYYISRESKEKGQATIIFDKITRTAKLYKTSKGYIKQNCMVHCTGASCGPYIINENWDYDNKYVGEVDLSDTVDWKLSTYITYDGGYKTGTAPCSYANLEVSNLIVETPEKKEFDGYMYYDDFNKNYLNPNLWNVEQSGDVDILVDSGRVLIYTGADGKVTLTPTKTFETEDIKLYFIPQNSEVYFAGQRLFTPIESAETMIEVRHRFKNDREVSVIVNGVKEQVFDTTGKTSDLKIIIPANQLIKIYYLKNRVIESCQLTGGNYMLGIESFIGPQDITLYSTRYPVKKFCPTMHPFTATRVDTENEVYYDLASDEKWSIGGEVLTLFYIFENDGNIPVSCGEDAYDVKNNKCINTSGVVFFCTEGVYDPDVGACVLIPDVIQCATVNDCPEPYCAGVSYTCENNKCVRSGQCIQPPTPSTVNIWDLISQVWANFWNWVKGLF